MIETTAVDVQQSNSGLTARTPATKPVIAVGEAPLRIDQISALSQGRSLPVLAPCARERMRKSRKTVETVHADDGAIYGVTTSVGASVGTIVPPELACELSLNVARMHGCGTGRMLSDEEAAAVLAVRLSSLAAGCSGVRPVIAERLVMLLRHRALPQIPAEGSVGASGDLTPLSYIAAVLVGEREVSYAGRQMPAAEALRAIGCEPVTLQAKEALALMNGTSVATALGCLAWISARRVARLAAALTSMTSWAIVGNPTHFDSFVHRVKPHPGQQRVAAWIREDLGDPTDQQAPARLQDRYSVRCAPHVIGVLVDALTWTRSGIEVELNGVSDNPVVDVERGEVLHGGNFYGGHIGFYCDALKIAVANVACLLDRQLLLLCNPAESHGLPADLVGVTGPRACVNNGFKATTMAASALTAEALKLTVPATSFSRSTELHNQDKVPMATLAARDLLRIVELTEQVAALVTLANCQALDLRGGNGETTRGHAIHAAVREVVPRLEADRRMDHDIAATLHLLRTDRLCCGDANL